MVISQRLASFWIQEYDERLLIDSIAHYQFFISGDSKRAIVKYVPIMETAKVREAYEFTKEEIA